MVKKPFGIKVTLLDSKERHEREPIPIIPISNKKKLKNEEWRFCRGEVELSDAVSDAYRLAGLMIERSSRRLRVYEDGPG